MNSISLDEQVKLVDDLIKEDKSATIRDFIDMKDEIIAILEATQ